MFAQGIHTNIRCKGVIDTVLVGLEAQCGQFAAATVGNFTRYNNTALIQINAQSAHNKKTHAICAQVNPLH
jgi:hypothetical protein